MVSKQALLPKGDQEAKLVIEQAFKQFSLESERLELAYRSLEERFKAVQKIVQESQTKLSGKMTELDFVSRYLEAILHHISQGILFIDLNGILTTCNEAGEKILGRSAKELLFHPIKNFFNDTFFGFSLEEALRSKRCPRTAFITLNQEDGEKIDLEIEATFVAMDKQSQPIDLRQKSSPIQGMLILLRDITEVRQLQLQAHRSNRLQELGEMAARLAHEIRNPLGGIRGFASLLYQDLQDRPELQKMAARIIEGTTDLNHFVTRILNYTRPFEAHLETTDIIHYIEDLRMLMLADASWNQAINFSIKTTLKELYVPFDPQLLKSALLNLFVNAFQAMPEGGTLTVNIGHDAEQAIIRVQDTGIGIQNEHLDKIFSPFFTTKDKGTGLGLSEVHKVIQAHQGWIEVHSEVGKGTVFIIKLPLRGRITCL